MIIFNAMTLCVRWRENLDLVEVAIGFSIAFNVWFIVEVRKGREERRGREGGRGGEGREELWLCLNGWREAVLCWSDGLPANEITCGCCPFCGCSVLYQLTSSAVYGMTDSLNIQR